MKKYNLIFIITLIIMGAVFLVSNIVLEDTNSDKGRPYRVEIERLCLAISQGGEPDISGCKYVTNIEKGSGSELYNTNSDYMIKTIGSVTYRFDYKASAASNSRSRLVLNISLGVITLAFIAVMLFVRAKLLKPFNRFSSVPYDLSKGKLTEPLEENKSRYFGKFVWGVNMLRENIIEQKQHELELLKEKQTLILSISHDIKTPLSAIKLYSKAMSRGLYTEKEKLAEVAESINKNADDIEKFVTQLTRSASEDFMQLEVNVTEFYLGSVLGEIQKHYFPVLSDRHTEFSVDEYIDCIIKGDPERSVEVLKNLMDNAIKYGDGKYIHIGITEEDGCKLVCVANSGCSLPESEMLNIFDSFWRGSNASGKAGSGLGLYICRQLMLKMDGEVFAEQKDGEMRITAVFPKA
ncbi:MAG: HAMP domain-containing histidine kinase [Ruminococcus sp.]|nr:HAMP domain-containing histidine kinase [Ruminococcus sp.]